MLIPSVMQNVILFKRIFPFVILFVLVLGGCDQGNSNEKILLKKWAYLEFKMNDQAMSGEDLGNPTMEFINDGTYKVEFGVMSEEGTWKLDGDKLETTSTSIEQTNTLMIVEISDEKLVFTGDAEGSEVVLTLVPFKETSAAESK